MKKMTGDCNQVENPRMISAKKCKSLVSKIVKDETHPLYPYITTLPHGHLKVPWSRILMHQALISLLYRAGILGKFA